MASPTDHIYEYINRRWVEETGSYPDATDCGAIVMVVAMLTEFHEEHCDNLPAKPYLHALPDKTRRGTLKVDPLPRQRRG